MSVVVHVSNNFMLLLEPKVILTHTNPIRSFTHLYLLYLGFTHIDVIFTATSRSSKFLFLSVIPINIV